MDHGRRPPRQRFESGGIVRREFVHPQRAQVSYADELVAVEQRHPEERADLVRAKRAAPDDRVGRRVAQRDHPPLGRDAAREPFPDAQGHAAPHLLLEPDGGAHPQPVALAHEDDRGVGGRGQLQEDVEEPVKRLLERRAVQRDRRDPVEGSLGPLASLHVLRAGRRDRRIDGAVQQADLGERALAPRLGCPAPEHALAERRVFADDLLQIEATPQPVERVLSALRRRLGRLAVREALGEARDPLQNVRQIVLEHRRRQLGRRGKHAHRLLPVGDDRGGAAADEAGEAGHAPLVGRSHRARTLGPAIARASPGGAARGGHEIAVDHDARAVEPEGRQPPRRGERIDLSREEERELAGHEAAAAASQGERFFGTRRGAGGVGGNGERVHRVGWGPAAYSRHGR